MTGPGATPLALPCALLDRAARPYRNSGRYAWHFARGKLAHDPALAAILGNGLIPSGAQVLDLGCGQGVLAALLIAAEGAQSGVDWPATWPPPPVGTSVRGIELMPRDVARARAALGPGSERTHIEHADIREADFGRADVVVLLDVLHYLDFAAQQQVLQRVHECLRSEGRLLLRVGDAAAGWRFHLSRWIDTAVLAARTRVAARPRLRLHCRPLSEWQRALAELGFEVESVPIHGRKKTPFANMLLIARLMKAPYEHP